MSELRNCPLCSGLFTYSGRSNVCPGCTQQEEICFHKVKEFIATHPGCHILEVASTTGVKEETIYRYLREGRLTRS